MAKKILHSPLGDRIRQLRKARKLSQYDLSQRIWGTRDKQSRIANWESGRNEPGFNDLYRLAQALDITPDVFMTDRPVALAAQATISIFGINGNGMKSKGQLPVFWPIKLSAKAFALLVEDNRYAPLMRDGECLLIDPNEIPAKGDVALIKVSGDHPVLASLIDQTDKVRRFKILDSNDVVSLQRSDTTSFLGVVISRVISNRKFMF